MGANGFNNCIINLDLRQYYFYQSDHIEIHAPDGTHLESIGHILRVNETLNGAARLKEQIILVECLLGNIIQGVSLPAKAISALTDLLEQMRSVSEKYIK